MVEAPGTAPGSITLIPSSVYRHSRLPDRGNLGCPGRFLKGRKSVVNSGFWPAGGLGGIGGAVYNHLPFARWPESPDLPEITA